MATHAILTRSGASSVGCNNNMLPPPPGSAVSNQATARHAVVGSRECSPSRPACNSITSSRRQGASTEDMHADVGSERAYTAHADDDDHTGRGQLRSGVMVCVRRGYQLPYRRLVGFDWCVGVEGYNILLTWVMACKQY